MKPLKLPLTKEDTCVNLSKGEDLPVELEKNFHGSEEPQNAQDRVPGLKYPLCFEDTKTLIPSSQTVGMEVPMSVSPKDSPTSCPTTCSELCSSGPCVVSKTMSGEASNVYTLEFHLMPGSKLMEVTINNDGLQIHIESSVEAGASSVQPTYGYPPKPVDSPTFSFPEPYSDANTTNKNVTSTPSIADNGSRLEFGKRKFALPADADVTKIRSKFDDSTGLLLITLPKIQRYLELMYAS
jgi:hypothetical protein